jgi:wyosine [tRNA(Phe)-imidazoG37] synthetase (radical SAM superfamily)
MPMKDLYAHYAASMDGSYVLPPTIEIDLTNECNQNCVYCCSHEFRRRVKNEASLADYTALIQEIYVMYELLRLPTLIFVGGGEPTLSPYFVPVLSRALELGFYCSVITNGTQAGKLIEIPDKLRARVAWVGVDMDAGDKVLYDRIRQPSDNADFHRVCATIKQLALLGYKVDFKVLLLKQNSSRRAIFSAFELASSLHVRQMHIRAAVFPGNVLPAKVEQDVTMAARIYRVPAKLSLYRQPCRFSGRRYTRCHALYLLPVLSSDGKIYLVDPEK